MNSANLSAPISNVDPAHLDDAHAHTHTQLIKASFNPLIRPYLVITIGFTLCITFIGIPLAIIWFLGVGQWWARHYFAKLECELGEKSLRYRKGILVQVEKTIPLENIQDVTFIEGPILKHFQLSTLKFETAGQSQGQAHDMQLTGIFNAHEFRQQIMQRREALRHPASSLTANQAESATTARNEQTVILKAIQEKLDEIAEMMREKK